MKLITDIKTIIYYVLQVFCNVMFKYANNALSNYICSNLHTFQEQKS